MNPIVLEDVRIASPCSVAWGAMKGDERVRFCGQCRKNVYHLSGMTREDAEALLRIHQGDLCVQIYQRADGTVLTQDCPVGLRALRARMAKRLAWLLSCAAMGIGMVAQHLFAAARKPAVAQPAVSADPARAAQRPVHAGSLPCGLVDDPPERIMVGGEEVRAIRGGLRSTPPEEEIEPGWRVLYDEGHPVALARAESRRLAKEQGQEAEWNRLYSGIAPMSRATDRSTALRRELEDSEEVPDQQGSAAREPEAAVEARTK